MKLLKKNNWIKAAAISLIIMISYMVLTNIMYETSDDFAISARIAAGYPYVGFVNYYLCKLLIAIQGVLGPYNAYMLFQLVASFAAFSVIIGLIFESCDAVILRVITVAMLAVYGFDAFCSLQFSKTAALLMTAGFLLIVNTITKKRNSWLLLPGFALVYLGVGLRADGLLGALGFCGIYGLIWLTLNAKILGPEGYFKGRKIVLYVMIIVAVAGSLGVDKLSDRINVGTDELATAQEYNIKRSNAVDFPTYEYYESNRKLFNEIGIEENDLYLIDKWFFDTDGAASLEKLSQIDEVKKTKIDRSDRKSVAAVVKKFVRQTVKAVRNLSLTGVHIVLLALLALWMLIALKPRDWPYVLVTGALTVVLYLALYYMQRPTYRAMFIADIGATSWMLYYAANRLRLYQGDGYSKEIIGTAIGIVVVIVSLAMLAPVSKSYENSSKHIHNKQMSKAMAQFFNDHKDTLYVFATTEKKQSRDYITPLRKPDDADNNVIGTGSWGTGTPYVVSKTMRYGVANPIKGVVDNENCMYVGNKNIDRVLDYYNKWYGNENKKLKMVKVDSVDGYGVWKIQ